MKGKRKQATEDKIKATKEVANFIELTSKDQSMSQRSFFFVR